MANSRKPDNVHILNGTYRKDRHGDPEAKPEWSEDQPEMPDWLDEYAQKEWAKVLNDTPDGVITKTDRMILAQYCMLCSKLAKQLHEFTSTDHTQLKLIAQQLGFTPSSRGKIGGKPKQEDADGFRPQPR